MRTLLASCRAGLQDALDHHEESELVSPSLSPLVPRDTGFRPLPHGGRRCFCSWIRNRSVGAAYVASAACIRAVDIFDDGSKPAMLDECRRARKFPDEHHSDSTSSAIPPSLIYAPLMSPELTCWIPIRMRAPSVELQLRSQRPVTLKGSVDNEDVKRVLPERS